MKIPLLKRSLCVLMSALVTGPVSFADSSKTIYVKSKISTSLTTLSDVGGVNGGGGGTPCAEFTDLFRIVTSELQSLIRHEVLKMNNAETALAELDIIKRDLRCLPANRLDRDARSNPVTLTTRLVVSTWQEMNALQKIRLVVHELAIILRIEQDGEYQSSENLIHHMTQHSPMIKNLQRARTVIQNKDGSTTFIHPFIMDDKGIERSIYIESSRDKRAQSLCRFFDFKKATYFMASQDSGIHTWLDSEGKGIVLGFKDSSADKVSQVIASVTCK